MLLGEGPDWGQFYERMSKRKVEVKSPAPCHIWIHNCKLGRLVLWPLGFNCRELELGADEQSQLEARACPGSNWNLHLGARFISSWRWRCFQLLGVERIIITILSTVVCKNVNCHFGFFPSKFSNRIIEQKDANSLKNIWRKKQLKIRDGRNLGSLGLEADLVVDMVKAKK